MKTSDNRPAIRFTGCTDAWHHCQFNDIVITHPTKQFIKEPSLDGTIEVIQQGNEPVVGYANGSPFEEYASVTVFGDHTVSIYKPKKPFFVATDGTKILSGNNIEGNFFYFLLERYKPIPEGYKRHFTILIEQECNFPKSDEQKHIAQYMLYLDDLIERNKRKYEKLVNLKKAMLDKMFPKNGELVPEVRFAGFSSNWERWKLAHYLETSYDKNFAGVYSKQDVLSVSGDLGVVNQIEFHGRSFAGVSVMNYGIVQTGDIVYTKSPLRAQPFGIIKTNKGPAGIVSTLYAVYHPKAIVAPDFVQLYFEHDGRLNNYLQPLVNKGAKNDMKISAENALQGLVCFPSLAEQRRIVHSFTALDIVISLHKQRLEILRNLKKAFLEKMFV